MEEYRDKIEQYGSVMEKMGLTPVAGRVYCYLLFCKEPGATFEDIVTYFGVSKSAVSNALKFLDSFKMADAKTIGGQRKRYFCASFESVLNEQFMVDRFKIVADMLEDICKCRNLDDHFGKEMHNVGLLYKMLMIEMPIVIERWKRTVEMNEKDT